MSARGGHRGPCQHDRIVTCLGCGAHRGTGRLSCPATRPPVGSRTFRGPITRVERVGLDRRLRDDSGIWILPRSRRSTSAQRADGCFAGSRTARTVVRASSAFDDRFSGGKFEVMPLPASKRMLGSIHVLVGGFEQVGHGHGCWHGRHPDAGTDPVGAGLSPDG